MIAVPALDLKQGACVQLVGGAWAEERVRLDDPLAVARRWRSLGFRTLHVVDLDAALDRGSNADLVRALLALDGLEVQVGGGVRDAGDVAALLESGAARVVVGTRALEDPAWLDDVARRHAGRLIVAADANGRDVVTRGWQRSTGRDVCDVLDALDGLPLAGVLVTAVHREGRLGGPDLELLARAAQRSRWPLWAAGGITGPEDLRALAALGVSAAVLGMALYTGALDAVTVAKEFES